jgi:hypothetical protein
MHPASFPVPRPPCLEEVEVGGSASPLIEFDFQQPLRALHTHLEHVGSQRNQVHPDGEGLGNGGGLLQQWRRGGALSSGQAGGQRCWRDLGRCAAVEWLLERVRALDAKEEEEIRPEGSLLKGDPAYSDPTHPADQ